MVCKFDDTRDQCNTVKISKCSNKGVKDVDRQRDVDDAQEVPEHVRLWDACTKQLAECGLTPKEYLLMRYFVMVAAPMLRAWDRRQLEGGIRMPPPPCSSSSSSSGKGRPEGYGRCYVIAFPSRPHMMAALPHVGAPKDAGNTWLPYVVAADPRYLTRMLVTEERQPTAREVLVVVGYYTLDMQDGTRDSFLCACHKFKREWWITEPTQGGIDGWDLVGSMTRDMWLAELVAGVIDGGPKSLLSAGCVHAGALAPTPLQRMEGVKQLCIRCGASAAPGTTCNGCHFVAFCSSQCEAAAAAAKPGGGIHTDTECALASVCRAATDAQQAAEYGAFAVMEESLTLSMSPVGRFDDIHCSLLLWDVTQPVETARWVPGIVDPAAAWELHGGGKIAPLLGQPLTAQQLSARLPVMSNERVHLWYFNHLVHMQPLASSSALAAPESLEGALAALAAEHAPTSTPRQTTLANLMHQVQAKMAMPPCPHSMIGLTASFLKTFSVNGVRCIADIDRVHRRFKRLEQLPTLCAEGPQRWRMALGD